MGFEAKLQRWAEQSAAWSSYRVTESRAWMAARTDWPAVCARCGGAVQSWSWHLGHRRDRQAWPSMTWDTGNWQIEHARCSKSAGAAQGNRRRTKQSRTVVGFSDAKASRAPDLARSVSETSRTVPETLSADPRSPGDRDGLPSVFPGPHPEAVGSRGDEYAGWVESETGTRLRWWQWLTAQRRYEVRADGSWCWLLVLTSVMRQLGKSVELARDGAWHGSLGLAALTLHSAYRVTNSRDVQAELWPWAEQSGLEIARQLGDSRIVWPDGSVWQTVAIESAYGRRPRRLIVDEAWAVDPVKFWNSLYPAMSGQDAPVQALFWSAANSGDLGLVADLRQDADVCRMEWGALPGEDHGDPRVWRACHPYWPSGREELMRKAQGRPGFAENWLNVWPQPKDARRWLPKASTDRAAFARVPRIPPADAVCGIECSLDGQRWSVAAAWSDRRGIAVRVWQADDLEACLSICGDRRAKAHRAIVERAPVRERWRMDGVETSHLRASTGALRDAVKSGALRVAGMDDAAWAAVRTTPADGGEAIDAKRSNGDVHSVKAAALSVWSVVSEQDSGGFFFGAPEDERAADASVR